MGNENTHEIKGKWKRIKIKVNFYHMSIKWPPQWPLNFFRSILEVDVEGDVCMLWIGEWTENKMLENLNRK